MSDRFNGERYIGLDNDIVGDGENGSTRPLDIHTVKMLQNNQDNLWKDGWRQSWTPFRIGDENANYYCSKNRAYFSSAAIFPDNSITKVNFSMEYQIDNEQEEPNAAINFGIILHAGVSPTPSNILFSNTTALENTTVNTPNFESFTKVFLISGDFDKGFSNFQDQILTLRTFIETADSEIILKETAILPPNQPPGDAWTEDANFSDCTVFKRNRADATTYYDYAGYNGDTSDPGRNIFIRDPDKQSQTLSNENLTISTEALAYDLPRLLVRNMSIELEYSDRNSENYEKIENIEFAPKQIIRSLTDKKIFLNANTINSRKRLIKWGPDGDIGETSTYLGSENKWPEGFASETTASLQENVPLNINISKGRLICIAEYIPTSYQRDNLHGEQLKTINNNLSPEVDWEINAEINQLQTGDTTGAPTSIASGSVTENNLDHIPSAKDSFVPFFIQQNVSANSFDPSGSFDADAELRTARNGMLYEPDLDYVRRSKVSIPIDQTSSSLDTTKPCMFNLDAVFNSVAWNNVPSDDQNNDQISLTLVGLSIYEEGGIE